MTPNDFVDATLKGLDVERTTDMHRTRDVIKGIAGLKLVEEPKPFLSE